MRRVIVGLIIALALGMFAGAVGAMAGSMRAAGQSGIGHNRHAPVMVVGIYLCSKNRN